MVRLVSDSVSEELGPTVAISWIVFQGLLYGCNGVSIKGEIMSLSAIPRRSVLVFIGVFALFVSTVWVANSRANAASATPVVYIATGENFPDALGVGPASALDRGPILLVTRDSVPGATATELSRLGPDLIVVVGGTAVISPSVESQLRSWAPVTRIAGANRYETAAAVSRAAFPAPAQPPGVGVYFDSESWKNPAYGNGFVFEEDVYVEVTSALVASAQVVFDTDVATPSDNVACGLTLGTDPALADDGSWRYLTVVEDNVRPTCVTQTAFLAAPGWHTVRVTLEGMQTTTYVIDRNLVVTVNPVGALYAASLEESPSDVPHAPLSDG